MKDNQNRERMEIKSATNLITEYPSMREPIIEGLLRRAETMNIIAPPKAGKSWLVLGLALSIAAGKKWLDKDPVRRGCVLLIDNELHSETLASRIECVASAMGLDPVDYDGRLDVASLRGRLMSLSRLATCLSEKKQRYDVIVLDAWYRFAEKNTDENSNTDMMHAYNLLDGIARDSDCAFVAIHHTSKGSQLNKAITDIGAGAGSASRAVDCHLTLRPHREAGALVIESVCRSFGESVPFSIRRCHPLFLLAEDLSPEHIQGRSCRKKSGELTKQQKEIDQESKLLAVYESLAEGDTANQIKRLAKMNGTVFLEVNDRLCQKNLIEKVTIRKGSTQHEGWKLAAPGHADKNGILSG